MKKNKINRNRLFAIIIVIVIILCIITIALLTKQKDTSKNKDNNDSNNNVVTGETEYEPVYENIIDTSKTENVKIENNIKINVSEELLKDKDFENMKITNIKLVSYGNTGVTGFTAKVENTSNADFDGCNIDIKFYTKDGSEISTLKGIIDKIAAGQTTEIGAYTGEDLANAYSCTITKS